MRNFVVYFIYYIHIIYILKTSFLSIKLIILITFCFFYIIFIYAFTGTSYQDLGACESSGQWPDNGQESSGSDQLECEEDEQTHSLDTKPCFILGEDICDVKQPQQTIQTSDTALKTHNLDGNQPISDQVVSVINILILAFIIFKYT